MVLSSTEDVSWLFDEDEINPPGMSDADTKTSATSSASSSVRTADETPAPDGSETWSMSSPHSKGHIP